MKTMIFYARAGYGHVQVGKVIAQALRSAGLAEDALCAEDSLDSTPRFFAASYPAVYLYCVTYFPQLWGWMYEISDRKPVYDLLRPLRSLANRINGRRLLAKVRAMDPDVIISTHFFTAELLASAKLRGEIRARLVTVITDFYPHTFWVNEGTDAYWVMSSEGAEDLIRRGVPAEKITAGGIPADPKFRHSGRREAVLRQWEMDPARFTILLSSGSFGLGPQEKLLRVLEEFSDRIQVFVVCGKNDALKTKLEAETFRFPVRIFGFVDFMPDLMEASDLMIAKSGGSTTVESLAKGIPMVVVRPIPGQESRNARLLKDRNTSFFIETPEQACLIVKNILAGPELIRNKQEAIRSLAKPDAADDIARFILKGDAGLRA